MPLGRPAQGKSLHRNFIHSSGHGLEGRGYGSLLWGLGSMLPASFSESSLGLGTGWNLSRTGGLKTEAFKGGDGVSSVLWESLQAEVLCRRQPRHSPDVGHQHTGPLEVHMTTPQTVGWLSVQFYFQNLSRGCLFKAVHCIAAMFVIMKNWKHCEHPSGNNYKEPW